jgi:hypothetical protein
MAKTVRAAACIAVLAVSVLTTIGAGLFIDEAHAGDSCTAAPGAAAPKGQHWYYRIDRATQRRCWYLHASVAVSGRAAADPPAAHSGSNPSAATPESSAADTAPRANAATPPSPANSADDASAMRAAPQSAPRVTVLNVKTVTPPPEDLTSPASAATPEAANGQPAPQMPPNATVMAKNGVLPREAYLAPTPTVREAVRPAPTAADTAAAVPAPTQSPRLLILLPILALGVAAALILLFRKIADWTRAPRGAMHPDNAWRGYDASALSDDGVLVRQEDAPFLAPERSYGPSGFDRLEWAEPSPALAASLAGSEQPRAARKDAELKFRSPRRRSGLSRVGKSSDFRDV